MSLDTLVIADCHQEISFGSRTTPSLLVNNEIASIHNVYNIINNPTNGNSNKAKTWASAKYLNGMYIYNFLAKKNYEVALINSFYEEKEQFKDYLKQKPLAIVISTTFVLNKDMLGDLVKEIRTYAPDSFIIAGGPFVYMSYLIAKRKNSSDFYEGKIAKDYIFQSTEGEPDVDCYVVSNCGLETLHKTISNLKEGKLLEGIPNIAFKKEEAYYFSEQQNDFALENLELDLKKLPDYFFESKVIALQASNGCPNNCYFCNFNKDINYRVRTEKLVSLLKTAEKIGVRYVCFSDDNFLFGGSAINTFCERLIEENIQIKWFINLSVDAIRRTNIKLLKEAGCSEVYIGVEAVDETILKNMNKIFEPEACFQGIKELLENGINCSAGFIVGYPGETKYTVNKTIKFINEVGSINAAGVFSWVVWQFILEPLSPIYENDQRNRFGLTGYKQRWKHDTMTTEIANKYIMKIFFSIKNSSRIYWNDCLDMMAELPKETIRKFNITRHELAKFYPNEEIDKEKIRESFNFLQNV